MRKNLFLLSFLLFFSFQLKAQEKNKKVNYFVSGYCLLCKAKIEKTAVKLKGIKYASWNPTTKKLLVVINEFKYEENTLEKEIVKLGYEIKVLNKTGLE